MANDAGNYSDVYKSWKHHLFNFKLADRGTATPGLRKPQLAALYAALGHLVMSPTTTGTVVMPTGTGKTDTMLGLLIAGRLSRTLFLVPSDALRTQLVEKCRGLKKLREIGAVSDIALNPIVNALSSKMSVEDVAQLAEANVIVATPQTLQRFEEDALQALSSLCSHLIIDEAHHVAAKTWWRVKNAFKAKPCLQFTATPFREDSQPIEGKIIYNYPLKDAQNDGYFKPIEFHPVREYNLDLADQVISEKAVELLRSDLALGLNHLLMVRAKSQKRAEELFLIYKRHEDLSPVLIHSKVKNRLNILDEIVQKKHKIIVCVDMLGEGFDLPELKIAAIHDQHKSPAVTLQFIGRLTRVDDKLGDAKFVSNIANQKIDHQMAALYKESADWSSVIRDVSHEKINREIEKEAFTEQFSDNTNAENIFGLNPNPKVSAVAFHVARDHWRPEQAKRFSRRKEMLQFFSINDEADTIIMVTRRESPVGWAQTSEIVDTNWILYLAYYHAADSTLFIHTSGDESQATYFLNLIAKKSRRINGEPTFRTLHNIKLMRLQNVGLSRARKDLRFTMHVGRDINTVISEIENGTAKKSNIFATGFELGERTTVGCSHKGKIWEMNSSSIMYWIEWCRRVSRKINDATIHPSDILKDVMRAEKITDSWPRGLFYADWPETIAIENEQRISLYFNGKIFNLLDIQLGKIQRVDDLTLSIPVLGMAEDGTEHQLPVISIRLYEDSYKFSCPEVKIIFSEESPLELYLDANPLVLLGVDGAIIEGNYRFFTPNGLGIKLPIALIEAWEWGATKIHKESMRAERDLDTVQGFTFSRIESDYAFIFNDDGSGEIADLVAIRESKDVIYVDLYHCKFCPMKEGVVRPGARVDDVYEVCGQASRSVKWLHTQEKFFDRLMDRYQKSLPKGFIRILKGDPKQLELLRNKCHDHEMVFRFVIVQPAISAEKISAEQLAVLGTSYSYIKNVSGSDIKVVTSP
ncbi:DEAD/DEAH box helicase family protein [Halomonas sp. MCCC 1A11036]|uniref:DEAD/DEAH box helicase family protein n=1 Tax=Billgrantia zhangzhouensis TaxID=2733481 RepID=A0ABS9AL69_9GAMM|nr:DEAD/DEAH box helicase family protein [Halomonas zhangzhouensis]MCE8022487.1 DEAD/DEAH box helicase family protein [Halomonas zhangzhouensis]